MPRNKFFFSLGIVNIFCHCSVFYSVSLFDISGYIEEFEIVDDHRAGKVVVNLTGRINKCGVISPRFDLPITQIEKWTNSLLPSRQFGYVDWD